MGEGGRGEEKNYDLCRSKLVSSHLYVSVSPIGSRHYVGCLSGPSLSRLTLIPATPIVADRRLYDVNVFAVLVLAFRHCEQLGPTFGVSCLQIPNLRCSAILSLYGVWYYLLRWVASADIRHPTLICGQWGLQLTKFYFLLQGRRLQS